MFDGRLDLEVTNVTFARFLPLDGCSYQPLAITINPLSQDALYPTEVRGAVKINAEWMNQEVRTCVLFVGNVQYTSHKTSHIVM